MDGSFSAGAHSDQQVVVGDGIVLDGDRETSGGVHLGE
jgi:hypothetical protein